MKCSNCGSTTIMRLDTSGDEPKCVYKCLNKDCGKETVENLIDPASRGSKLKVIREHIEKVNNTSDIPILISNLKKIRNESKIGQGEISKSLGITPQRYGTIERCENIPTITREMELSIIFNVSKELLYATQFISIDDFEKLRLLKAEECEGGYRFVEDPEVLKMEKEIAQYEEETGISDRIIYNNSKRKDTDEVIKIKKTLKSMDKAYSDYCKKNLILKQKKIIDYYHWDAVKSILTSDYDN